MKVAVGLIIDKSNRILVTQRSLTNTYPGFWEFPGGKLEANETAEEALSRELHEELGIEPKCFIYLGELLSESQVQLMIFLVTEFTGIPACLAGQIDLQWLAPEAMDPAVFPDANRSILRILPQLCRSTAPLQLKTSFIETPLGLLQIVASESAVYFLDFFDKQGFEQAYKRFQVRIPRVNLISGTTAAMRSMESELQAYFQGKLSSFTTPVFLNGSTFQQAAWLALRQIPYGQTRSYREQAESIGKASAYRAVGSANGANPIVIAIPCHRVIRSENTLGGYGGGLERKQWLIDHERQI